MQSSLRKNLFSLILTIVIIAGAVFVSRKMASNKQSTVSSKPTKKERVKVELANFPITEARNSINIDGRLQAHDRVNISSRVQGTLQPTGNNLRAGRYYEKGSVLFIVDSQEISYNLKAQRSSLLSSITQMMPDLKFDYPQSFASWDNYLKNLNPESSIKPLPQPFNDQEKYFVASKNIYNQYYAIKSLETQLSYYNIISPFSGILTEVNAVPGASINQGQVLASMINTSTYEMVAPIELANLKYVKPGQKVLLSSEELGKTWNAKVSRIGTLIDQATQNIPLYISVSGEGLKDGMFLKGQISGSSLSEVTKLPKSAFISPTELYTVQDSTLVILAIEPVKRLEEHILAKGLSADTPVVISNSSGLFAGQKVNF